MRRESFSRQVQSKLKVIQKLQEEMDAIPQTTEDPMLRFQFIDVRSGRVSQIAATTAIPDSAVE